MLVSPRGRERSPPRFLIQFICIMHYMTMQVMSINDIFVRECGPGHAPTIVMLHGGGISGWMWDRCASMLYDYHCLIPDMPEHGQSSSIKPFTIKDSARRIADLIRNQVPGGRAHVVGHSLGGQVLVALLATAPQVPIAAAAHGRPNVCDIPCSIASCAESDFPETPCTFISHPHC